MKIIYKGNVFNEEQIKAVALMKTGEDLKIEATAGSGKTTLLEAGAHALRAQGKKGIYIAFTKTVAKEASHKFPDNVECTTAHSLAYGKVGWKYKDRLKKGISGSLISKYVHIEDSPLLNKYAIGNMVLDTIRVYCFSANRMIQAGHVPFLEIDKNIMVGPKQLKDLQIKIAGYARQIWEKMSDQNEDIPITHDVYLKLWSLDNPYINKDFVMFDEVQDANAVMLDIVEKQKHLQRIYVGDRYQQIFRWRGAVNAMDIIETKNSCQVSQSFRFGEPIANKANEILNTYFDLKTPVAIRGNIKTKSAINTIPWPDAILCRTNASVISRAMEMLKFHSVFIAGGVEDTIKLVKGVEDLQAGRRTSVEELASFKNWQSVKEFSTTKSGGDLKSLVGLVESYGTKRLIQTLTQTCQSSDEADITITTVHKAKGLEWERVKLSDDFKYPTEDKPVADEEVNILYVAITRALKQLDISDCKAASPSTLPFFRNKEKEHKNTNEMQMRL